jgi:septal ring factor EnvC (AmiA/AmiB activator)
MDPELVKKMDKVSSRMVVTQRRVNEINNRIKSLQSQYKSILRTVKKVEQGMLEEQVKVAEEQKKAEELEKSQLAKQKQRAMEKARAYEYSAPNNPYFDSYQ